MNTSRSQVRLCFVLTIALLTIASASGQDTVRHVSSRVPIQGNSRELAAERPAAHATLLPIDRVSPSANHWRKLATLPGAVIHDISFATQEVGYAAAELGQVWKTTNGGKSWQEILNLSFPYYWYGVKALSTTEVVISGFNDSNFEGIIRWSTDGGTNWSPDIVLTTRGWSDRVRFFNSSDGVVLDQLNFDAPNAAHFTIDGGAGASDWTAAVPDPNGGWFGDQFSLLANGHLRASGITFCASFTGGANWSCKPAVDSVFDGPVFFTDDLHGWVGGGEISPNVEGWLHRTVNGGKTWSDRTLDIAFPVREILFISKSMGWAAGGNIYSNAGGIYFSSDGGKSWSLDVNTGAEMKACDQQPEPGAIQVWCAGFDASFNGVVYSVKKSFP